MHFATATASRSMNTSRRLRSRSFLRSLPDAAPVAKIVKTPLVRGNELFDAVTFLGEALGLPRLQDTDTTSEVINLAALRAAAAAC